LERKSRRCVIDRKIREFSQLKSGKTKNKKQKKNHKKNIVKNEKIERIVIVKVSKKRTRKKKKKKLINGYNRSDKLGEYRCLVEDYVLE